LTPTLSQRERELEESPLPRFGGEGQGEGACHDYHGLPAFETLSSSLSLGRTLESVRHTAAARRGMNRCSDVPSLKTNIASRLG
ncbi:MAG: hypothetical protein AB1733_05755, partial [Thermodesulfobacteriota bacterium]